MTRISASAPLYALIVATLCIVSCKAQQKLPVHKIKLPPGFKIEVYADNVPNARSLALGAKGTVFVSTRQNKVYALVDANKDNKADKVHTIAEGLNKPNGIAFRNGSLYVAEISKVSRYDKIEGNLSNPPKPVVIKDDLPTETHHGWKFIAFGPDGKLYVPIGTPCNNCLEEDKRFASITRINPDGSGFEVFAHGVRNTVGFDWHPQTKELWFTDNGRDWLGDNKPPDELNRAHKAGIHFGFPFCHGKNLSDPEFGEKRPCSDFTPPAQELGPHVAALGMRFYTGTMFPKEYRNHVFIAEHGSWNRTEKIGYRIMLVKLNGNKAVSYEPFATGWLDGSVWGRPVDVLVMPDGAMLVSDDAAGAVYRITYAGK